MKGENAGRNERNKYDGEETLTLSVNGHFVLFGDKIRAMY